jgi:hypothetical protein
VVLVQCPTVVTNGFGMHPPARRPHHSMPRSVANLNIPTPRAGIQGPGRTGSIPTASLPGPRACRLEGMNGTAARLKGLSPAVPVKST